ncbi:MAG TPA: DUF3800 domain-containing protein [Anaerolineae bacterium]|nr:DUF3800 domain-containing protein [Anaerolineae bacterium]
MTSLYRFAFGDEAGDTGLKFNQGSSTHFVPTLVLTNDPDRLYTYVRDFRDSLGLHKSGELSFHRTPDRNRLAFLRGLTSLDLAVHALIVDKRMLLPELRGLDKLAFYTTFFTALLLRLIPDELEQATVTLDEFGSRNATIIALRQHLKRAYGGYVRPFVKRLTARRSRSEPALQAADMVAGAVFRYVTKGDMRFYEIIRPYTTLWEWTGNKKPPG